MTPLVRKPWRHALRLLALLSDGLAALEANCTSTMLIEPKRESVKRVLNAIVTRYGIDLTD